MTNPATARFSDFVIYADESGDHSLTSINADFPVFCLTFCIFPVHTYVTEVVPAVQRLKFDFFGHDQIVLHENEIRRATGEFGSLQSDVHRERFMARVATMLRDADVTVVAAVINKQKLLDRYSKPRNPYHLTLLFCLERIQMFLQEQGQSESRTHIVVERRGAAEDRELRAEFDRIRDGHNQVGPMPNLELRSADKRVNSTGMQIADLIARPISLRVHRPNQPNRAFDVIEKKLRRSPTGETAGWGFKLFP